MGIVHAKEGDRPEHKFGKIIGLPDAEVNYDECEDTKSIPLDVPVRVDTIHIDGLGRTKNDVVEQAMRDVFQSQSFRDVLKNAHKARLKLETLGCFRNISVHIDVSKGPKATPDGLEVTFHVKELKRIVGGVNTEVGNNEGALVVGLRAPNTFGRGERIFVEYSYGSRKSNNFTVGFVKPFLGKHEPRISASIFQNLAEFSASGFKELENGVCLDHGFYSLPTFRHNFQYKLAKKEKSVLSRSTAFEVREESGVNLKSAVQHILTIDLRDDVIFPSCGSLFQLTSELAGFGGDIGFLKNDVYLQGNYSFAKDFVLQATASCGHLRGISNNKKIGLTDMFFLGGPLDLRGFQMRGIGPRAEGDALGADTYWATGLHLFTPLPFRPGKEGFGEIFRTHLFLNCGNFGVSKSEQGMWEQVSRNVRVSAGLGIAIRLGHLARVEINYCFPMKYDEADQTQPGVQFGIGVNFS